LVITTILCNDASVLSVFNQSELKNQIKTFPNPASDYITFGYKNPTRESVKLELYDLSGNLLSLTNRDFGEVIILDVSALPSGTYTYKLSTIEDLPYTGKVIIN